MNKKNMYVYTAGVVVITMLFTLCVTFFIGDHFIYGANPNNFAKTEKVLSLLDHYYLYGIDKSKTEDAALKGLVSSLGDPYTTYFNKEDYAKYNELIQGKFYGVGLMVKEDSDDGHITVSECIDGSPAQSKGIQPGDEILKIDGEDVSKAQLDEAVNKIKGEKGTDVTLSIYRKQTNQSFDVTITRDEVTVPSVQSELLSDNIGLVHITTFSEGCDTEFISAVEDLKKKGAKSLVIDLRDNPGGLLEACTKICDYLLPEGTIVYTQDKNGKKEIYSSDDKETDLKMAVLVNGNTASAAEITSAALKDYGKAVIIGQQTYGKGVVQSTFDLDQDTAVKITISEYFSPNGSKINGVGVTPDIVQPLSDEFKATDIKDIPHEKDNQLQKALSFLNEN